MTAFIRRFTSFVAALALTQATAAPVMSSCQEDHRSATTAITDRIGDQAHHGDADCPESIAARQQEHERDCLVSCVSMPGCSAPSFVVETSLSIMMSASLPLPSLVRPLHPGRLLAPDRPPPRA